MLKDAGSLSKGMYLLFRGAPCLIAKCEFMNPGKGSAIMRLRLKNVESEAVNDFTYKTSDKVEIIDVEKKVMQFLYADSKEVFFMDPFTFEQISVRSSLLEGQVGYLLPNMECFVLLYLDRAIGVIVPPHVRLKVVETEDAVGGNTVSGAKKAVKLETGIEVMAPLFIKTGDTIMIDTLSGEYQSRVN